MQKILESTIAQFKGSIYPSGQISIGYCARKKKTLADSSYEKEYESQLDRYEYTVNKYGRIERGIETFFSQSVTPSRFTKGLELSQPKKPPRKYGSKGISRYGSKCVTNIAIVLERKYKLGRIGFGTCTLPGFSTKALWVVSKYWGQIVRRFYQSLRRDFKRNGAPLEYVGVTEVQPQRWKKRKEVALHLHFAYVATDRINGKFYVKAGRFREIWKRAVLNVLRKYAPQLASMQSNFGGSVHLEMVNKSVSGYLGKYLSKGTKFVKELIEEGYQDCLPSQWWTASAESKKQLKKAIVILDSSLARDIFYAPEDWKSNKVLLEFVSVWVEISGEERRIGMAGKVFLGFYYFLLKIQRESRGDSA